MAGLLKAAKAFVGRAQGLGTGISGRARRLSRIGAAIMSAAGTLLVAIAVGGIAGASASPKPPAATPSSSKSTPTLCDSSGSGEAELGGALASPGSVAPNYNTSSGTSSGPGGALLDPTTAYTFSTTYFDESGFTTGVQGVTNGTSTTTGPVAATNYTTKSLGSIAGGIGTITGPWPSAPGSSAYSDSTNLYGVFPVSPATASGSKSGVAITGTVGALTAMSPSPQPGYYALTIGTGDQDDKTPAPCSVQWVMHVGSPSVSVAKSGPATGTANGQGTYTLTASNSGSAAATNVTVTDSLPVGETFVSSSNSTCAVSAGAGTVAGTGPGNSQTLACTIASLAAGANTSFTVTVSYGPNVSGTLTDCATVPGQATPSCVPTIFQGIAGHIYLCSNGSPTITEVPGGALSATGPQNIASGPNPLADPGVPAGTYTMSAAPPTGYQLVTCGGTSTVTNGGMSATESVVVPGGGTGTGIFYVTPVVPSVTLSIVKTNDANGSGTYAQSETATAPGEDVPFRAVITNTSTTPLTITSLADVWPGSISIQPSCATTVIGVTLAPQGSVTCDFTVANYAPAAGGSVTNTVTVIGCQSTNANNCGNATSTSTVTSPPPTQATQSITLSVTKTNDANGSGTYAQTETATSAGEAVPFRVTVTNTSSTPITITSLTDAWPSQSTFSPTCSAALVGTTLAPGASGTCDFTLADYAPAAGGSVTNTATVTGCQVGNTSNCGSAPANSTVDGPPVTAPATKALAFTGPPAQLHLMLVLGLGMASCGFFFLWLARPRRKALERS